MNVSTSRGAGLEALPQGTLEYIVHKSRHKITSGNRVKQLSAFDRLKKSMADGTSNDALQGKARYSSEHKVTARLIQLQNAVNNDNKQAQQRRLNRAVASVDFQTTHREEIREFGFNGKHPLRETGRRTFLNLGRFTHMLGDLCNGITSAMKEVANNAVNPNDRKKSGEGKAKMAIGACMASLLIGMNSLFLRTCYNRFKGTRGLTAEALRQKTGIDLAQAQLIADGLKGKDIREINQISQVTLEQTGGTAGLSQEQTAQVLDTLHSLNAGDLVNSFVGWYWQGCGHYGMSVLARSLVRYGFSGHLEATDSLIQDKLTDRKNKLVGKIFELKQAVEGCRTDEFLVRTALKQKIKNLKMHDTTIDQDLWQLVKTANSVDALEKTFADYFAKGDPSPRELNRREEHFMALANLVEHFKIPGSGGKNTQDRTGRLRVQDFTMNGLPFINEGTTKYKGSPVCARLAARIQNGTGGLLKKLGATQTGEHLKQSAARRKQRANQGELEIRQRIAARATQSYKSSLHSWGRLHDTQSILKDKSRHSKLTVCLARASETMRFIGHHGIVSSDTNLGRVLGRVTQSLATAVTGKRHSLLIQRAIGMTLGVGAVGIALSFASIGFSSAVNLGAGLLALGGIPLGNSGISMSYASLAVGCMAFLCLSSVLDSMTKASVKLTGVKSSTPKMDDLSLMQLGPAKQPENFTFS